MTNEPMTEQELREIEGLADAATEDPDDMDRLATEAVPQMAAEIRRAWAENEALRHIIASMDREPETYAANGLRVKVVDGRVTVECEEGRKMDRLTVPGFKFDAHYVASHLQSYPIAQSLSRLSEYEDADLLPAEITAMKAENARLRAELEAGDRALDWVCLQCGYEPGWEECAKCPIHEWRYRDAMSLGEIANTPAQGATDEARGGGEG